MQRFPWFPALSLMGALLLGGCTLSPEAIDRRGRGAVVLINYQDQPGFGTGFLVEHGGIGCAVLTAAHVVEPSPDRLNVTVAEDDQLYQDVLVVPAEGYDLALIRFQPEDRGDRCPYGGLPLGVTQAMTVGNPVWLLGYPDRAGENRELILQTLEGKVTTVELPREGGLGLAYDIISAAGMSGGPVLNQRGQVVAIHSQADRDRQGNEFVKWGVDIQLAFQALSLEPPVNPWRYVLPGLSRSLLIFLGIGGAIVVGQAIVQTLAQSWQSYQADQDLKRERLERARLEERLERERQAQEAEERLEQERQEAQQREQERLERERQKQEARKQEALELEKQQLIQSYNTNPGSLQGIGVSETQESFNLRRSGLNVPVTVTQASNPSFYIVQDVYLVPRPSSRVTTHKLNTFEALFDCENFSPGALCQLIEPAIVSPLDNKQWQLQQRGKLRLEERSPQPTQLVTPSKPAAELKQPLVLTLKPKKGGKTVPLELLPIPGGTFWMGRPDREDGSNAELPRHRVTVPPFLMGRYPVTQAQYEAVMGDNPATRYDKKFVSPNQPIIGVSWDMAVKFCEALNQLEKDYQFRLPTEAEWEYACRAGTETAFYFGDKITPEQANFNGNYTYNGSAKGKYREVTTPVGQFPANAWGLQDMHGNVWEWCADEWYDSYAQKPEQLKKDGSIPWTKKFSGISPSIDGARLLRGGSCYGYPWDCRSALRNGLYPSDTFNNSGFRVVVAVRIS